MQCVGAILAFGNERSSIAELITAILGDGGYVVRTSLDSMPVRAASIAQPPALIVLDIPRIGFTHLCG